MSHRYAVKVALFLVLLGLLTACENNSETVTPIVPGMVEATVKSPTAVSMGSGTERLPSPPTKVSTTPLGIPTPDRGQRYWTLNITTEQYDQALQRWRSYAIEAYELAFDVGDYTQYIVPEHLEGQYTMRVSGQRVNLLKRMPTYFPKPHSEGYNGAIETATAQTNWETFLSGYTIEALFDRVRSLLNSPKPMACLVFFDPDYGFPSRIICRNNPDDVYESMDLEVFAFRPLTQVSTPTP